MSPVAAERHAACEALATSIARVVTGWRLVLCTLLNCGRRHIHGRLAHNTSLCVLLAVFQLLRCPNPPYRLGANRGPACAQGARGSGRPKPFRHCVPVLASLAHHKLPEGQVLLRRPMNSVQMSITHCPPAQTRGVAMLKIKKPYQGLVIAETGCPRGRFFALLLANVAKVERCSKFMGEAGRSLIRASISPSLSESSSSLMPILVWSSSSS